MGTIRLDRFAQTNVQLYRQVVDLGYDDPGLARLRAAYDLAMRLHATRFRPSGQTFISHLVATASILATLESTEDVVLAGLLHGAYDYGDFGDGLGRGITASRRQVVRQAIGENAESRVAAYSGLGWSLEVLEEAEAAFDSVDELGRDVLRMRLANELEDNFDLGALYSASFERHLAYLARGTDGMTRLARDLGHPELADALVRVSSKSSQERIPHVLRSSEQFIFELVPASFRLRTSVKLRYRWAAMLGRHPRAGRLVHQVRRLAQGAVSSR